MMAKVTTALWLAAGCSRLSEASFCAVGASDAEAPSLPAVGDVLGKKNRAPLRNAFADDFRDVVNRLMHRWAGGAS